MLTPNLNPLVLCCFLILWMGGTFGSIAWMRWRRTTRWPFKESDRLLRSPGETLRRRIIEIDERFILEFGGAIFAILLSLPIGALVAQRLGLSGWQALAAIGVGPTCFIVASVWRTTRLWRERASYFLGWFGERLAAEHLRPLQLQGYRVFHDLPCEPGQSGFNIDHVVVGPTGVAIVETKTRRKGNAREGLKDHEAIFDGNQIIWPWGNDRRAIEQTINQAAWLESWIHDRTGLRVGVKRVIALPGWYVRESPSPVVRVVNPKILPDAVRGRGDIQLSAEHIDLIARQLDERCRDVRE